MNVLRFPGRIVQTFINKVFNCRQNLLFSESTIITANVQTLLLVTGMRVLHGGITHFSIRWSYCQARLLENIYHVELYSNGFSMEIQPKIDSIKSFTFMSML